MNNLDIFRIKIKVMFNNLFYEQHIKNKINQQLFECIFNSDRFGSLKMYKIKVNNSLHNNHSFNNNDKTLSKTANIENRKIF